MPSGRVSRTYRVRKIPFHIQGHELAPWLCTLRPSIGPVDNILIRSLACDFGGTVSSSTQLATIQFKAVPFFFDNSGLVWELTSAYREKVVVDIVFNGFTVLHEPPPSLTMGSCLFISGFGSHPYYSWASRPSKGGGPADQMWPRDQLRFDMPGLRTMLWGDNTGMSRNMLGHYSIMGTALLLQAELVRLQSGSGTQPLIICAHGLGGLVVKQALVLLAKSANLRDLDTLRAVSGLVLFGVPHDGMPPDHLRSVIRMHKDGLYVEDLDKGSAFLSSLDFEWQESRLLQLISTFSVVELRQSPAAAGKENGTAAEIPEQKDADEHPKAVHRPSPFTVHKSHCKIAKFPPNSNDYRRVLSRLRAIPLRILDSALPEVMPVAEVLQTVGTHMQEMLPRIRHEMEKLGFKSTSKEPSPQCSWPFPGVSDVQSASENSCRFFWINYPNPSVCESMVSSLCSDNNVSRMFCPATREAAKVSVRAFGFTRENALCGIIYDMLHGYPEIFGPISAELHRSKSAKKWSLKSARLTHSPAETPSPEPDHGSAAYCYGSKQLFNKKALGFSSSHSDEKVLVWLLEKLLEGVQEPLDMAMAIYCPNTCEDDETYNLLFTITWIFERICCSTGIKMVVCVTSPTEHITTHPAARAWDRTKRMLWKWRAVNLQVVVDMDFARFIAENLNAGLSKNPRMHSVTIPHDVGLMIARNMCGSWDTLLEHLEEPLSRLVDEEIERAKPRSMAEGRMYRLLATAK